jgi:hypothetical protein
MVPRQGSQEDPLGSARPATTDDQSAFHDRRLFPC